MNRSNFTLEIDNKKAELTNDTKALAALASTAVDNFYEQDSCNRFCIQYAIDGVAEKREFISVGYNIGTNLTLDGSTQHMVTLRATPCPPDELDRVFKFAWNQRPKR